MLHLLRNMAHFTDKELRIYEAEIRKKPLPMLYRERDAITNDPTPERQNIVKARIEALEDRKRRIDSARQREQEKRWIAEQQVVQKLNQEIIKQPQPLPDKKGFKKFLILIGIVFAVFIFALLRGPRGRPEDGLLFTIVSDPSIIRNLQFWRVFKFAKFLPAIGILFWYSTSIPFINKHIWKDKEPSSNLAPEDFWLRNFKIALSIASFLFFLSLETFARGEYNGLFYSDQGQPAYIIALGYLVASTLYIINAFFPIIKRFRPKFGITLLAFVAILEACVKNCFS